MQVSAARIVTTTERFDEMGKLVERIAEEKFTEECGCACAERNKPETQKATCIRFSFLCPDPKTLGMEVIVENGKIVERPRAAGCCSKEMR